MWLLSILVQRERWVPSWGSQDTIPGHPEHHPRLPQPCAWVKSAGQRTLLVQTANSDSKSKRWMWPLQGQLKGLVVYRWMRLGSCFREAAGRERLWCTSGEHLLPTMLTRAASAVAGHRERGNEENRVTARGEGNQSVFLSPLNLNFCVVFLLCFSVCFPQRSTCKAWPVWGELLPPCAKQERLMC